MHYTESVEALEKHKYKKINYMITGQMGFF